MARPRPFRPLRAGRQPAHHRRLEGPQRDFVPQRRQAADREPRPVLHPRRAEARCVVGGVRARWPGFGRHSLAQLGGDVPRRFRALHRRRARRPLRHPRPARQPGRVERRPVLHPRLQQAALHHQQHPQRFAGQSGSAQRRRWRERAQLQRRRFLVRTEHRQPRHQPFLRSGVQRPQRAFGLERRDEKYKIFAGEPGSYIDADGVGVGGNAGSQGFPGFQPGDAGSHSRDSWAAYADVEADFTDRFTAGVAVRYEDYSDFGKTTTGKLAAGFRATDTLMFRASASTGFRAPSLQQKYFSSTITDFVNGEPVDVVIAPNGGTIANAAGLPLLTKEKSRNYTLGLTWSPSADTSLTLDAYRIDIDDRIVLSGRFDTTDPTVGSILDSLGVGQAQFFVNSVDTRTEGVDFTFNNERELGNDFKLGTFFALNLNRTKVNAIHAPPALVGREDVLLSERERLFIEQGAPKSKAVLGFDLSRGAWDGNLKLIYFGPQTLGTFSGTAAGVPNARYKSRSSADLSVTYAFSDNTKLTVGATNLFNVKPSRQNPDETDNGHVFDSVQFGLNGTAYFVRLWHKF
ncbi:TonB-dependent receptor plug domain-containing protein [Lysobacter capsici]|uniref:TonB-dependent receptor plug domain-containing protein n=1 Tax=Lysobacter capsici TaxID=435897 RepID=UPI00398CFF1F